MSGLSGIVVHGYDSHEALWIRVVDGYSARVNIDTFMGVASSRPKAMSPPVLA